MDDVLDMAVTETGHLASRELDDLYRRHGSEVYRYAFAVLGNHADAEDVTQTTFLNAYRALEQGVRPRKPSNWLLTIASNAIKQRFRTEQARPRQVELDERTTSAEVAEVEGPTVGELLAALSKIPPQQRQAIVLREFEGRSYAEIADILGVTTTALETLLFRARRSLAEELEHQLTCTEAQAAISRAADDRLGRKERRRLRDHLGECPDCARFASVQQRHRRALKGLMLLPVPLSLHFFKGLEGTATAATLPVAIGAGAGAGAGATTTGGVFAGGTAGGLFGGGAALKAAAVVATATLAGGVAVTGSSDTGAKQEAKARATVTKPGERIGQTAPRGVLVPGNGVARGKAAAPGQSKREQVAALHGGSGKRRGASTSAKAHTQGRSAARASARAHSSAARNKASAQAKPAARNTPASKPSQSTATHTKSSAAKSSAQAPKRVTSTSALAKKSHAATDTSAHGSGGGGPKSP